MEDIEVGIQYLDDPKQRVKLTAIKVYAHRAKIKIEGGYEPPRLSGDNAKYGYAKLTGFSVGLTVEPSAALNLVLPRLIQVGKGSFSRFYRMPPSGKTKSVADVPNFSFDGQELGSDPGWAMTSEVGWFTTDQAGDVPQSGGACETWRMLNTQYDFEVYVQYSLDGGTKWYSLKKGTWSFLGSAEMGASVNGQYPEPTGMGAISLVTADFSDFFGDVTAPTPSMPVQINQFSDQ